MRKNLQNPEEEHKLMYKNITNLRNRLLNKMFGKLFGSSFKNYILVVINFRKILIFYYNYFVKLIVFI